MALRLFFKETLLGVIEQPGIEGPEMYGWLIQKTPEAKKFEDFWAYMVSEDAMEREPPFSPDVFNDDNWFIEEEGKRRNVFAPGVHEEGIIYWRWRD